MLRPILWGPGKAAAVQKFAAENDIDLKDSYFYADGDEDVALMYLVGNPRPTNPEGKMAAVARRRGWPILRFTSRGGGGIGSQLRTLAGFGSVVPVAAGAVGIGLLTRSRRRGVNFFTSTWSQLLLAASGVHLNVIGAENLTAERPAVFIFNHRNQADPVISGALVRDNWVGVGKKELASDPVMGTLGKLLDTAFIDRDDAAAAVETLHQVEERAAKGLSIVMAPEGTRLDTTSVGPFKKGAFRIAMTVGIPIVPIVIRNAEIRRRAGLDDDESGHGGCRCVPADLGQRLDTGHAAGSDRRGPPTVCGHVGRLAGRRAARNRPVSPRKEGGAEEGTAESRQQAGQGRAGEGRGSQGREQATAKATAAEEGRSGDRPQKGPAQNLGEQGHQGPAGYAAAEGTIVTRSAADTGSFTTTDDTLGVGVGVLAGGIGTAREMVGPATCPAPGDQARGAAVAGPQLSAGGARTAGRTARVGRGPVDRAGAGLLDAAGRRVGIEPGGGAAARTKSVPAQ